MLPARWSAWQRHRQQAAATRHVAPLLETGEVLEIVLNGLFGTVSGARRGSAAVPVGTAGAMDPFEIALTDRRLLAIRGGLRSRRTIALSCDREAARAVLARRGVLFDRVQFAFGPGSLTLRVHRVFRQDADRLTETLGD